MILTISPSGLNTAQECPTKYNFSSIRRLSQIGAKRDKMDQGSLFHEMLEMHYNLIISQKENPELALNEIIMAVTELAREKNRNDEYDHEIVEACIRNYQEYAVYYADDGWSPLKVETPFTKEIFKNDQHTIVMEGIIDLITENLNSKAFPVDHKTESKISYPTILSNQFTCYAWATESDTIVKNRIGFQTSKGPGDRFHRDVLSYTKEHIEEWRESVIYHSMELIRFIEKDYFPMREVNCWNCWFKKICEATPDAREYTIIRDFTVRAPHNIYDKRT